MGGGKSSKKVKSYAHKHKRIIFVVIVILLQLCVTAFQASRYSGIDAVTGNSYRCVEMSRDSERFFESLGIHVYQITGHKYNSTLDGDVGDITASHRWILLDFGFIAIPFESTAFAFFNPEWVGFKDLSISEGYVCNGEYYNVDKDMDWSEWK